MAREVVPTICPYCAVGCSLYAVVENGRVAGLEYLPDSPVNEGRLCSKGNAAFDLLDHPDRLRSPQKKVNGNWVNITWDEASEIIAENLMRILDCHGPDALGFVCSGKCTNEENYLFQKLARLLGTNNIDHCARLCHSSTLIGLTAAFGAGAMTNPLPDLALADCLLIIGSNISENHPVASRWILEAKDRGACIIVADPRYTPTAWVADIHLRLKPGADVALINAMMHVILKEGLQDAEFIARRTRNYAALERLVAGYRPSKVSALTGVPASDIVRAARAYAKSKASSIVYCMGITQHRSGTQGAVNCANLAMLCGQIGRPGTGVNPMRGQNNVQGACDMGGLPSVFPGYQAVGDPKIRADFAALWGVPFETFSPNAGLTLVEMEEAALSGRLKGMYIMGENPLVAHPNSSKLRESLRGMDFLVVQDIFATRTSAMADVRLPAAASAEKSGSKTATDRRVQWSFQAVEPPGEARPDWWIICRIAERLGLVEKFGYGSTEEILAEISRAAPIYGGVSAKRLRLNPGGLHWPCPNTEHPGTPILYEERFENNDGRGVFVPVDYEPPAEVADEDYPLALTTGRMTLHYNSGSMSRRTKSLMRRVPELYVEINVSDASALEIGDGEHIYVVTRRGEVKARARVTHAIDPGVLFMPFHFPETNELTVNILDPQSGIPALKVAACRVRKAVGSRSCPK